MLHWNNRPNGSIRRAIFTLITSALLIVGGAGLASAHDYEVERGDTLSEIASEWEVPGGWKALYRWNRDEISNPNLIYPGQVFHIKEHKHIGDGKADKQKASKKKSSRSADRADGGSTVRPGTGEITSSYGMRTHPITGEHKLHSGTDFGYGDGTARAARAGEVVGASWADGYGNMVTIRHSGSLETRYAHLETIWVNVGERVKAGQGVGAIGSTGYSTGPHLHFEVLKNGEFIDPMGWLD